VDKKMWWIGLVLGAINGTDFINHPWNTTFGPYTNLFSAGFYLIPLCFIAAALYLKTHNGIAVSCFIWGSGLLLVSASMFANYPEMALVFLIFTAAGLVGTFLGVYLNTKWK
jgi:hypothetical protein